MRSGSSEKCHTHKRTLAPQQRRRIPLDYIDQEKIDASFKNGVLNVTLPKSPTAQQKVRRIAINGK